MGVYPLYKCFNTRNSFGRIEPEDSVDFIRAIDHPVRMWIPRPAACFRELLGLGQASLTPLQCLPPAFAIFAVSYDAGPFNKVPAIIASRPNAASTQPLSPLTS